MIEKGSRAVDVAKRARIHHVFGLLRASGLSASQIAERLEVSIQATTGWLKTGKISVEKAEALALLAGLEPSFVTHGARRSSNDDEWTDINAFSQRAALGDGVEPEDYAETHRLKFRAQSLVRKRLNPDNLRVVYGRGDSMLPRIRSGDAILFDTSDVTPRDEALYVVTYDGKVLAKQLVDLGGRWFIQCLNRDSAEWRKPHPIDEHKGFQIHGRIRWIGSWED